MTPGDAWPAVEGVADRDFRGPHHVPPVPFAAPAGFGGTASREAAAWTAHGDAGTRYGDAAWAGYANAAGTGSANAAGTGYGNAVTGLSDGFDGGPEGRADAWAGWATDGNGYGYGNGYADGNGYGYADGNGYGYADGNGYGYADGTGWTDDGNGYADGAGWADDRTGWADEGDGYRADDGDGYREEFDFGRAGAALTAPDFGIDPESWRAEREARREAGQRGAVVGAVTQFLAAAVAVGVSTLVAGFVRPQASPIGTAGNVFVERVPLALRTFAVQHFGGNGRAVLLLGMYVVLALLAMEVGVLTRRTAALGVASIAGVSLLGAFIVITRSQSHVTDVIPTVVGAGAGVVALLWLQRSATPALPLRATGSRPAQRRGGRRAR